MIGLVDLVEAACDFNRRVSDNAGTNLVEHSKLSKASHDDVSYSSENSNLLLSLEEGVGDDIQNIFVDSFEVGYKKFFIGKLTHRSSQPIDDGVQSDNLIGQWQLQCQFGVGVDLGLTDFVLSEVFLIVFI